MKKALVVNLYAGAGALKTGTAAGILALLKLHGVDAEAPYEFPKDLVWEEGFSMIYDQNFTFGNQSHRLWRVADKVDVVIMDCPIMLNIVYRSDSYGQAFVDNVVTTYKGYNNLDIVLERDDNCEYIENGRAHTKQESIVVDNAIVEVLEQYSDSYTRMVAGYETINNLTALILERLGLELKYKMEKLS